MNFIKIFKLSWYTIDQCRYNARLTRDWPRNLVVVKTVATFVYCLVRLGSDWECCDWHHGSGITMTLAEIWPVILTMMVLMRVVIVNLGVTVKLFTNKSHNGPRILDREKWWKNSGSELSTYLCLNTLYTFNYYCTSKPNILIILGCI